MIAVLIAIVLAVVAYWICIALGLPWVRGAARSRAGAAGRRQPVRPTLVNEPAAAVRVAVAEAVAEYTPDEIRAMVEFELRAQALDSPLAHG
jgi:hypothetical protein